MDKIETFEQFLSSQAGQISPLGFVFNMIITALFSYVVGVIYVRYANSLSNRKLFSQNFIVLSLTTMIIISIIKSSLALSLGLVGALSIIRFRSAIKEPEELTYIFICIAIGLGMGADQAFITGLGIGFTLLIIIIKSKFFSSRSSQNLHLTVSANNSENLSAGKFIEVLDKNASAIDLKRFDENNEMIEAAFLVEFDNFSKFEITKTELRALDQSVTISFMDNKGII